MPSSSARPYSTCLCRKVIEETPPGVWRSVEHPSADRIACAAADNGRHHPHEPGPAELPIQAGGVGALGLPQEPGDAA